MKKFLFVAVASVLLAACTPKGGGKLSMSTKADFDVVKEIMVEHMGDVDYVTLVFTTDNYERCTFEQVAASNIDEAIFYTTLVDKTNKIKSTLTDKEINIKPAKVADFSVDEFVEIKGKALSLIESKTKDFGDFKVRSLIVTKTEKGGSIYLLDLIGTKNNPGISYVGKKINPDKPFYQFSFQYNTDTQKLLTNTKGLD